MIIIIKLSNIFSGLLSLLQRTSQLCAQIHNNRRSGNCIFNYSIMHVEWCICIISMLAIQKSLSNAQFKDIQITKNKVNFLYAIFNAESSDFFCLVRGSSARRKILSHYLLAIWPDLLTWKVEIIKATCRFFGEGKK